MRIHLKSALIVGATVLILLSTITFAAYMVINDAFSKFETSEALDGIALAQSLIDNELNELIATTLDWSSWDDTYYFMDGLSQSYIDLNLANNTFQNLRVNIMLFIGTNGNISFGKAVDLATCTEIDLPAFLVKNLSYLVPLTVFDGNTNHSGALVFGEISVLFCSSPILTSFGEGPSKGTLIMIRYFDALETARIQSIISMPFDAIGYDSPDMPQDFAEAKVSLSPSDTFIKPEGEETLAGFAAMRDPFGNPAILFKVEMPRTFIALKSSAFSYFTLSIVIMSLVVVLVTFLLLRWAFIIRITRLGSDVNTIATTRNFEGRVPEQGDDEIFTLAHDINRMLLALQKSQISLKEYSEHLEDLVKEKTKQLQAAERLAAIGETAAMVGHDLRSPLQAAVNTIYLARDSLESLKLGEKDRLSIDEYCNNMSKYLSYMNKIVSDLQDFARPMTLDYSRVDLKRLLIDAIKTVQPPKSVEVSVDVDDNFPKVRLDQLLMQRLSTNLISNAVQAMPGGGAIKISAELLGGSLVLKFSDTGIGIPKDNLSRLFMPLFTTRSKGSGFGLAVCKRIAEAHGGTIAVDSKVGVGTTFMISIPQPQPLL